MSDSIKRLPELLDEVFKDGRVTICFCTLCSHQPEYGHCYACPCGNHQPTPVPSNKEEQKLQFTVSHLIRLLHLVAKEKRVAGEREPESGAK